MKKYKTLAVATAVLLISISTGFSSSADNGNNKSQGKSVSESKSKDSDFWTADRIKRADVFDMVFEPGAKVGKRIIAARGSTKPSGGTTTSVIGSSWTKGGLPLTASGKVFFAVGTAYYQCSGALVRDGNSTKAIVLTAGHCVYDNATFSYVTNWIFIPSYDVNLVTINGCAASTSCWSAQALEANIGFTSQTLFTTQATLYDWGFATISQTNNGKLPDDDGSNSFEINFGQLANKLPVSSFGYPAGSPYSGNDLVYSSGLIAFDSNNGNNTYSLPSNMTGGCSGGPWLSSFASTSSPFNGILSSVNSYKYGTTKFIYGPKFNAATQASYNAALAK